VDREGPFESRFLQGSVEQTTPAIGRHWAAWVAARQVRRSGAGWGNTRDAAPCSAWGFVDPGSTSPLGPGKLRETAQDFDVSIPFPSRREVIYGRRFNLSTSLDGVRIEVVMIGIESTVRRSALLGD
jgi:hypothetical protein